MRLLEIADNDDVRLTKDLVSNIPPYAILSHTWGDDEDEVTFQDFKKAHQKTKPGYQKIRFCTEQATRDGLKYIWVDTCCIDKSNHSELSESIISMFRYYGNAVKCYVYLVDVSFTGEEPPIESFQTWGPSFRMSRWFTRGWTLQELIAPQTVNFMSKEGKILGSKNSLERLINEITRIPLRALQAYSAPEFSHEDRFSWIKNRETKREEDLAYSLLGLFNVSMPVLYGEGANAAFRRLRAKVNKHSSSFYDSE